MDPTTAGISTAASGGAIASPWRRTPTVSTANYSGSEFWINFTGGDLNTADKSTAKYSSIISKLAVYKNADFTNEIPNAIENIVDLNPAVLKLNLNENKIAEAGVANNQTLYIRYNPAGTTDVLEATDGTDIGTFDKSFTVDLSGVTGGGAGAPTFSAPTFSSSTGILNLPVATGSLDTAPSGSLIYAISSLSPHQLVVWTSLVPLPTSHSQELAFNSRSIQPHFPLTTTKHSPSTLVIHLAIKQLAFCKPQMALMSPLSPKLSTTQHPLQVVAQLLSSQQLATKAIATKSDSTSPDKT